MGDSSINVQQPICPFHLSESPLHCSHLKLSKPLQSNYKCSTHLHPPANLNMWLCCNDVCVFTHTNTCATFKKKRKEENSPLSSPKALLELQAIMNDPLDKLQFSALCHDLRHPARVHWTGRRSAWVSGVYPLERAARQTEITIKSY